MRKYCAAPAVEIGFDLSLTISSPGDFNAVVFSQFPESLHKQRDAALAEMGKVNSAEAAADSIHEMTTAISGVLSGPVGPLLSAFEKKLYTEARGQLSTNMGILVARFLDDLDAEVKERPVNEQPKARQMAIDEFISRVNKEVDLSTQQQNQLALYTIGLTHQSVVDVHEIATQHREEFKAFSAWTANEFAAVKTGIDGLSDAFDELGEQIEADFTALSFQIGDIDAHLDKQDSILGELLGGQDGLNQQIVHIKALLEEERTVRLAKAKEAEIKQRFDAVSNACKFLVSVAEMTGSKTLAKVGTVGGAVTQISDCARQLKTLSEAGKIATMAAINPIVGIGMAVLSIARLGRKKSNVFQEYLVKNLRHISEQNTEILKGVGQLQQGVLGLAQMVHAGFQDVMKQTMQTHQKLDDISAKLKELTRKIDGQEVEKFRDTVFQVEQRKEDEVLSRLGEAKRDEYLEVCATWLTEKLKLDLLTGVDASRKLETIEARIEWLKTRELSQDFGGFVHFARKNTCFAPKQVKPLFNLAYFSLGLGAYATLTKLIGTDKTDPKGKERERLKEILQRHSDLVQNLQTEFGLFENLIEHINEKTEALKVVLTDAEHALEVQLIENCVQKLLDSADKRVFKYPVEFEGLLKIPDDLPPEICTAVGLGLVEILVDGPDTGDAGKGHASLDTYFVRFKPLHGEPLLLYPVSCIRMPDMPLILDGKFKGMNPELLKRNNNKSGEYSNINALRTIIRNHLIHNPGQVATHDTEQHNKLVSEFNYAFAIHGEDDPIQRQLLEIEELQLIVMHFLHLSGFMHAPKVQQHLSQLWTAEKIGLYLLTREERHITPALMRLSDNIQGLDTPQFIDDLKSVRPESSILAEVQRMIRQIEAL